MSYDDPNDDNGFSDTSIALFEEFEKTALYQQVKTYAPLLGVWKMGEIEDLVQQAIEHGMSAAYSVGYRDALCDEGYAQSIKEGYTPQRRR